jgi:hypothetical protein
VKGLPKSGRKIVQPEIMAGDGHQKQNDQAKYTKNLEGKFHKGFVVRVGNENGQ